MVSMRFVLAGPHQRGCLKREVAPGAVGLDNRGAGGVCAEPRVPLKRGQDWRLGRTGLHRLLAGFSQAMPM